MQETVPGGYTQTGANAGYDITVGRGGVPSVCTSDHKNFADFQNATITGKKFTDLTGDGLSAGDTGLGGVTINLYQGSSASGTFLRSEERRVGNGYRFANLASDE